MNKKQELDLKIRKGIAKIQKVMDKHDTAWHSEEVEDGLHKRSEVTGGAVAVQGAPQADA